MSERELRRTNARIDARAKAMQPALLAIFRRWAQVFEKRAQSAGRARRRLPLPRRVVKKADTPDKVMADLAKLLEVYGVRQAESAARAIGAPGVPQTHLQRIESRSTYTAQQILARMETEATRAINRLIVEAMNENPPATEGEIAKRIREQFHGATGGRVADVSETDTTVRTGVTKRLSVDNGVMYWVSSERAAAIARTEIGEAEEAGKVAGYDALGANEIEWISKQWAQGRHQSMNGQRVKLDEKFTYPDGSAGSYPRSADSPVRHRVNCACTTKPIFARKRKGK